MSVQSITATELLPLLDGFDTIIDARSEDEYALDNLCNHIEERRKRAIRAEYGGRGKS